MPPIADLTKKNIPDPALPKVGDVRSRVGGQTNYYTSRNLPKVSTAITAKDLTSTPPLTTPPPPVVGSIPSRNGAMVNNVATGVQNFITAQTEEAARAKELAETYGAMSNEGSLASVFADQRRSLGIDDNLRELQDIQLRLADTDTSSELTKTRVEGAAGQTLGQAQREVTQEDRENAVRRSGDAARAAVLQGNIQTATALAKDAVDIAFQDRSLKAQNLINQLNYYQGVADDQTAQLLEQDKRVYEAELATIKELKDNIATAMVNGASQAEIAQLNDPNLDDASKLALAQSITARNATGILNQESQLRQAQINSANRANQPGPVRRDTDVVEQDGRKLLIDLQTGEVIKDYSGSTASTDELQKYENATREIEYDMSVVQRALQNDFGLQTSSGAVRNATLSGLVAGPNVVGGVVGLLQARVAKDNFLNDVNYLINKEGFQRLQEIKAASGTLGQITEKEFERVSKSASVLNSSAIRDDQENLVGFRGDEGAIRRELNIVMQGYMTIQDQLNAKMGLTEEEDAEIDSIR